MSEHPDDGMLAAFALDALSRDESHTVAAHLASCATCTRETDAWRESQANLALLAPTVAPPADLKARVLARAVASGASERTPAVTRPSSTAARPSSALARPSSPRWMQFAAAASILVAAGLGIALVQSNTTRVTLEQRLAAVTALAEERDASLAERDSLLARVLGPETRIASLAATGAAPSVRLFWDVQRAELIVSARQLPPVDAGRTYQLWGIGSDGVPVGLGTFNSAADGRAVVVLAVGAGASFSVSAVTVEPEGGSPAPTSTPILVGNWSVDPIQSRQ